MSSSSDCPSSFDELDREYRQYVVRMCSRFGVRHCEAAAQDILVKFWEKDIIGQFDPDKHIEHHGIAHRATFRNFLTAKVHLYCLGIRERETKRSQREVLIDATPGATALAEVFGESWDSYDLEDRDLVGRIRDCLAVASPPAPEDPGLLSFFDELVREVREDGRMSVARAGERFGIKRSAASALLAVLREKIKEALTVPAAKLQDLEGVSLSLADVRTAIDTLEGSPGIMVKQPLAAADHPLAVAKQGWYHRVAKAEIKEFPHLKNESRHGVHGAAGFGHVKTAVLHRLHRMLGEEPVAEIRELAESILPAAADPEIAINTQPREELEAELWKAGLPTVKVDRILSLADAMAAA